MAALTAAVGGVAPPARPRRRGNLAPLLLLAPALLWLVVFYITSAVGIQVPLMSDLDQIWNIVIGMTLLAGSFILATLWK